VVGYLRGQKTPTVRAVVDNLRKAKVDARVKGVLLKPTGFESPFWAKVQEIRDAVLDFRKSGKPIYAYLEYGGDREYYLATAADKVFLMPSAPLDLTGVATYELFLRGTLDKMGAVADLHRIGDYKTAVNTFTEKGYTAAHREMDESLNRDLYEQVVRGIADGRHQNEADVRRLFDQGPFLPEDALQAGRVGVRVGRDLARADDHEERESGSSAHRVDVGPRRVGRLLHRDAGAGDRRAAVDADGIDRDFRRQDRHRRRVREARRAHRVDERRPPRGNQFAGAPVQPGRAQEAAGAAAGVLRPVRREGRRLAAQH